MTLIYQIYKIDDIQEYIERGKSAKATVREADLDIYKNWVGMYNTAVTIPNQLIFESVRDEH